jgi:hypothetical protein
MSRKNAYISATIDPGVAMHVLFEESMMKGGQGLKSMALGSRRQALPEIENR